MVASVVRVFMNSDPYEDDAATLLGLIPRVANFVLLLTETTLDDSLCLEELKVIAPTSVYLK